VNRFFKTTLVTLACLLTISCSSRGDSGGNTFGKDSSAQGDPTASLITGQGFDLVNFTGATIRAVYLSPGDSSGWEENVLGGGILNDGATVDIRFTSNETPALWDLKVVATNGYYAEWKGLDLRGISRVTLAIPAFEDPTVIAELE